MLQDEFTYLEAVNSLRKLPVQWPNPLLQFISKQRFNVC